MSPTSTFRGLVTTSNDEGNVSRKAEDPHLCALLVFDDSERAERAVREIGRAGYQVESDLAKGRFEVEVRLRSASYDVVLAGCSLAAWSALNLLGLMRDLKNPTPVIVLSSNGDGDSGLECLRAGAADFIPVDKMQRLPTSISRAVSERRSREQQAATDDLVRKLTLAIDQSPASVIFTDTSGTIQYVNQRFTEVTGYVREEAVGRKPSIIRSGLNPRSVYADMWRTIRAGKVWRGELQNRRKNGELYWDSVSISPIKDSRGTVTHFLGSQEDITERRNTAERIRESDQRFRQLADNMHEVFFVSSGTLREMLYISPGYEHLWGRTCQSVYDDPQSFIAAIVDEDREKLFGFVATMQKGDTPQPIEYRIRRPDGSLRWVLVHAAPIRNESGAVYRITGTALDVTDRHTAEDALKESEARFRLLTEASFDGIVISVNGIIREANQGLADMFGCSVEGAIGRPVLDFVDAGSHLMVKSRMQDSVVGVYEVAGKHASGRKMILEVAAKNHTYSGEAARITAVRDITEQRLLETQFRQAQKMEAVGRLAGGVAHDFNNLLTVIMTYTQLVSDDLDASDGRRADLEEIQKASVAASGLTRQLLAFSRQQVVEPRLVLLQDVVRDADKMLRRLIGEDIELSSSFGADDCSVVLDPNQIEQVIMNLAVNARDAMPVGGKLTLETSVVDLDDSYARDHWPLVAGRYAMLAVTDTGIGMSEETKGRIFEPFFTTKEVGKGTGLGLAMVYGIVKQSNGFIWVYSEPERGTTFKLYFPLAAGTSQPGAQEPEHEPGGGTETVLLVEDSPAVRGAAARILQRFGYTVIEAPTSKAAIDLAAKRQDRIDLLLTDVVMPGVSGREVAERFSQLRPSAKILFMSGYTDDAVVRHGILKSGVAYLQKPFTGASLAEKVRSVLDLRTPAVTAGEV